MSGTLQQFPASLYLGCWSCAVSLRDYLPSTRMLTGSFSSRLHVSFQLFGFLVRKISDLNTRKDGTWRTPVCLFVQYHSIIINECLAVSTEPADNNSKGSGQLLDVPKLVWRSFVLDIIKKKKKKLKKMFKAIFYPANLILWLFSFKLHSLLICNWKKLKFAEHPASRCFAHNISYLIIISRLMPSYVKR